MTEPRHCTPGPSPIRWDSERVDPIVKRINDLYENGRITRRERDWRIANVKAASES